MKLKYFGHSAFLLTTKGKHIVIDPFITPNPAASHVNIDEIPADVILLTHGHGDHVADVASIAQRTGAPVVAAYEVVEWFGKQEISGHPLNHGGQKVFEWGTVKMVNAVHSSTLPDGTPGGNPAGFVIWNDEGCIYISGDTALTLDMQLIPMTCPPLDLAVLCIGDNFTMGYRDAITASNFIKCDRVVGCHFDTFPYIEIDHGAAVNAFAEKKKKLVLPHIGQEIEI